MSFKTLRIAVLLAILGLTLYSVAFDRAGIAAWDAPLRVVIYPYNATPGSGNAFITGLKEAHFKEIERYFAGQAKRYKLPVDTPFYIELANEISTPPPGVPASGNLLARLAWVARLRWWHWRFDAQGKAPQITVIAAFHDARTGVLGHSTGLERVRVALVNLFADPRMIRDNQVILAHEILHTVGARDKYDPATNLPRYPEGYAAPAQNPLYPQRQAEIMGGRIPHSATRAAQPANLAQTLIGEATAAEIGWLKPE